MAEYISKEEVINITAETGAWETQKRVRELKAADVQPIDRRISVDDICKELAQLIGIPCIFRSAEEILLHRCEDCCPRIPDSECWKRYFDIKFNTDAGSV